jgi:arginase family enzyme
MKFVKVPGINGLGKTKGARDFGDFLVKKFDKVLELDNDNLEEQLNLIYDAAEEFFHYNEMIIFVGGDHSISYSIARAFFDKFENGKIVVFDAHPDLMQPMQEPTHEEWLRALVEQGVNGQDILLVGARKIEPEEKEFLKTSGIRKISVDEVRYDLARSLRKLREFISQGEIYISFDLDVFDAEIVKATGYPEKDGLDEREILKLLGVISEAGERIKGGDIVEGNLEFPEEHIADTVSVAKEVLNKLSEMQK